MFARVEDSAQPLASSDVQAGDLLWIGDRRWQRTQRPGVRDALMGPVVVVEDFELTQGAEKVVLVPDQGAIEELTAAGLYPPLHDRVHSWPPYTGEHHRDPRIGQDGIEQPGELPVWVPDQEPRPASGVLKIHDRGPGGLGHPRGSRMRGHTQ